MGCRAQFKALVKGLMLSQLNVSDFIDSLQEPLSVGRIGWEMGCGETCGEEVKGLEGELGWNIKCHFKKSNCMVLRL